MHVKLWFIQQALLFSGVMGEYEPKIEVQYPEVVLVAQGATVKLECFALGKYVCFIITFNKKQDTCIL